jgi:glucose-6-phosphate isomerase
VTSLTATPAWRDAAGHHEATAGITLEELFAADPDRAARFTRSAAGITVDQSRTHLTPAALASLFELARQEDVLGWRDRMRAGECINHTEERPALHMALRTPEVARLTIGDERVDVAVDDARARMRALVDAVRSGRPWGASGGAITDVVHIGIGGSDLGPRLACEALTTPGGAGPRVQFIANIDPAEREAVFARLDPARTLVIVASKTFSTLETLANARAAHALLADALGETAAGERLVAITGRADRARDWGIADERILPLWDWVGGRYSLWSPIGLPVAMAVGMDEFEALCAGAAAMDRHFLEAPAEDNLPLRLALGDIWYTNFVSAGCRVVVPYAHRLRSLPFYLQQLEMESNGKSVDRDGEPLDYATAPAVWGQEGTNGQHAFFQWLHQGTQRVPCDIIAVREPGGDRDALAANAFGQAAALMGGRDRETLRRAGVAESLRPHRAMPGDRPTTTLLLDELTPETLGALLALHEHRVFCQAMIWRINPFDQWGVELGKERADALVPVLRGEADASGWDASTRGLVARWLGGE